MNQNRCPYVVEVYGYVIFKSIISIIMEYMEAGNLFDLIHVKHTPLSIVQRMRMARHCALGLSVLHSNNILHRDIKSMNVLLSSDYTCKLTDFGCAKTVNNYPNILNTINSGTPLWMAPEVKMGVYSFSADVYSLGLVLFEIFEQQLPQFDMTNMTVIIPQNFESASVIFPCISSNPNERPSIKDVLGALSKVARNLLKNVLMVLPSRYIDILSLTSNLSEPSDADLTTLFKYLLNSPVTEIEDLLKKVSSLQTNQNNLKTQSQRNTNTNTNQYNYNQTGNQPPQYNSWPKTQYNQPDYREQTINEYLNNLNIQELKQLLIEHNIRCYSNNKEEFITLIRQNINTEELMSKITKY